jgi:hexokinase
MLNDAIRKRGELNLEVTAILNDTTGTLVQGAYLDKSTGIGLILGTGSNACYIEKAEKVLSWEGERPPDVTEVIIDLESGAFGDNGVLDFVKTEFDTQVDNNSLLVGSFTFEKYIAGKYLGELVRVIIVRLHQEKLLFTGELPPALLTKNTFTTRFVSFIEEDSINNKTENTKAILEEMEVDFDLEDVALVKHVCFLATNRAAKLVSVCLAHLLERMDRDNLVTIAVDGSLFQFHPRLRSLMETYIHEYAPKRKFALMMAEDGSGKGAVMVTAIASKLKALKNGQNGQNGQ